MQDLKRQRALIYLFVLPYILVIGVAFHFGIWTVNNNKIIEIRTKSTGQGRYNLFSTYSKTN